MIKKLKNYLFKPRFHFNRFQLNLFVLVIFSAGAIFGVYYLANSVVLPRLVAADSPWTDTDWSTETDYTSVTSIDTSTGGQFQLDVKSNWLDSEWDYRKPIEINNSGSEQTDFQIQVEVNTAELIAAGKLQDECQDVRFGDSSGDPLTFYQATACDAGVTRFWIKVDTLSTSTSTIYLYYGNEFASSASDRDSTFDLTQLGNFSQLFSDSEIASNHGASSDRENYFYISQSGYVNRFNLNWSHQQKYTGLDIYTGLCYDEKENRFYGIDWSHKQWSAFSTSFTEVSPNDQYIGDQPIDCGTDSVYVYTNHRNGKICRNKISDNTKECIDMDTLTGFDWGGQGLTYAYGYLFAGTSSYGSNSNRVYVIDIEDWNNPEVIASWDASGHTLTEVSGLTWKDKYIYQTSRSQDNASEWQGPVKVMETEPTVSLHGSEEDKLAISGNLKSVIFDAGFSADWGDFVFDYTGNGTVTIRARTSNNDDMSGAAGWTSTCNVDYDCVGGVCTSSTSLEESTDCVTNEQRYFQYQVVLEPDGAETPTYTETRVHFEASDQTDPEVQASNSKMYTASGGTEITDADEDEDSWTNDSIPYFSWTEGEDDTEGSGILGYCLYLGTSSSGDPRTSKGILGTSPEETASTDCSGGFIIGTNEIDFTTSSYRGGSWLSSNGSYYLNITAIDNSGNAKGTPFESFHFQYDGTDPANPSGLSAPQTYQSQIENITVYWATTGTSGPTDEDSEVAGYQYRIGDRGTWYGSSHTGDEDSSDLIPAGVGYYTLDTDHDELTEGENTFYLRTWDNAGNVSASSISAILKYSGNAPSEPNELAVNPTTNDENSFSFSWATPTTYDGQASGLSYCYTINAVPSSTNCTWTSETSLTADAYATQPSTNTLYVVAKDEAGNVNYDAYDSINFDCDTSAPGVPQNMDIADVSVKATSSWKLTVSWEEPEDTGAGIETYQIYHSTDGESYELTSTATGISYVDTGLTQVTHYYKVKACDSANNCGAFSEEVSLYPDGKFTEPAGLTAGPTVSGVTTKKATISWSTDRTADSKIQYGTGSGDYFDEEVSSSTHTTDHSITLTNLSAGQTYYYRAKWTDEDGNTGMSEEKTFTTDPAPSLSAVEATDIGLTTAYINFTISNATKASIQYGETTSYGGLTEVTTSTTESSYSVQLTGLADGTKYHYRIIMEDSEGEEYISDNYTDLETLPRPRISTVRLEEITGSAQPAVLVSWQTNTAISSILTYYPTDNPGQAKDKVNIQLKQGEHRMLLKDLLPDKTYVLVVKGRDKVGNEAESDQQTFTTATDTRPPVIGNLKVEGTIQGTGEEAKAQLLVSFNTDEPATSQVEFGEGTGTTYSQKTQEDADLTNNHLVIVPNLSPSKVYHLRAIAKDKAGNETKSVDTVSITPKATESALNLVITNLSEVFGFLNQ